MTILANVLINIKSFKERQRCLSEAMDHLSFSYPDVYYLLYKEIKKREIDSNNPNKISKWITNSNSYEKLHESLILVKTHNILAKEEYLDWLNRLLYHTIESGTHIGVTVKICHLIEKSPHLKSIHHCLKDTIQRVYQLNDNKKCFTSTKLHQNIVFKDNLETPQIGSLKHLNFQSDQQECHPQLYPIWPTILQPWVLKADYSSSVNNYHCLHYHHVQLVEMTNRYPGLGILQSQIFCNLTIVDQGMDDAVYNWLQYLKLHKFTWFFNSLGYAEIESIHEDNIEGFIIKVNTNIITRGAQKKICIITKSLRDRQQNIEDLLMKLDLEVTLNELCEYTTYMEHILHYPIPNKNCSDNDQLQRVIVCVMEKLLNQLLEKLSMTERLIVKSLLGKSINTFLECTLLITQNIAFTKQLIKKTLIVGESLKCKIHSKVKNFN